MPFNLQSVVRENIWNLAPYTCARDEFEEALPVMLDANENCLGACLNDAPNPLNLERYPDPRHNAVKAKLLKARKSKLTPSNLFFGVGSDEAIDMTLRIFCKPGVDKILQCPPTYGMYKVSAQTNDVGIVNVPLMEGTFQLNVPGITASIASDNSIKVVFLCTPNNPTGGLVRDADVLAILSAFNGIVVVDEAYVDFSGQPGWSDAVLEHPNLIVMQTFSKSFGLAAARLGMAYASEEVVAIFNKVKAPYNVSSLTADAASRALENDAGEMRTKVAKILAERLRLEEALPTLRQVVKVYPSDANFLLVKVLDATRLYTFLASKGVVVRNRCSQPLCDGCLRITVGTPEENDELLKHIAAF